MFEREDLSSIAGRLGLSFSSGMQPSGLAAVLEAAGAGEYDLTTGKVKPLTALPSPVAATMSEAERLAALDAMTMPGAESVIARAKADGRLPVQIAGEVLAAYRAHMVANGHASYAIPVHAASAPTPAAVAAPFGVTDAMRAGWGAEWDASGQLQAEFPTRASYVGYAEGVALGRVKVLGAKAVASAEHGERPVNMAQAESTWRDEWHNSAQLQRDFGRAESYANYRKGVAEGRIRSWSRQPAVTRQPVAVASTNRVAQRQQWTAEWQGSAELQRDFATAEAYANYAEGVAKGHIRVISR